MLHKGGDICYGRLVSVYSARTQTPNLTSPILNPGFVLLLAFKMNSYLFSLWMAVYGHKIDTIRLRNVQDWNI